MSDLITGRLSMPDARDVFTPRKPDIDMQTMRAELAAVEAQRIELGARLGRGEISMAMLDAANAPLRQREAVLEAALASAIATSPVAELLDADDIADRWMTLDLDIRRGVLQELMTVTVLPAPRGRRPDGTYFDPSSVRIDWKDD